MGSGPAFASYQTVPPGLAVRERIPGIGEVPVRAFFFILLAFAILVGPVAYFVLRRRRALAGLVIVVPVVGALFTLGILGFGFLSEGLGTRGVVRTFTLLDQRDHEAVTAAGRTLFASFGPSSLSILPDTVVQVPDPDEEEWPFRRGGARSPRVSLDLDRSALGGEILPSRTVTSFATVSRARARERLRRSRSSSGPRTARTTSAEAARRSAPSPSRAGRSARWRGRSRRSSSTSRKGAWIPACRWRGTGTTGVPTPSTTPRRSRPGSASSA
jgi:hypothetical protein